MRKGMTKETASPVQSLESFLFQQQISGARYYCGFIINMFREKTSFQNGVLLKEQSKTKGTT
jgi:hypothetical protein